MKKLSLLMLAVLTLSGCHKLDRLLTGDDNDGYVPPANRSASTEVYLKSDVNYFGLSIPAAAASSPLVSVTATVTDWGGANPRTANLPEVADNTGPGGYKRVGSNFTFYWVGRDYPMASIVTVTWVNTARV
jgi:hypothetical protein